MLLKSDIEFMKQNRAELVHNRTDSVILHHKEVTGVDPFTGDETTEPRKETVQATWRLYISQSPGTDDRTIVNGTVATVGDAFAKFDLDVDLSDVDTITHVDSGTDWRIKGIDKVGIGEPNRQYVLLGRVV